MPTPTAIAIDDCAKETRGTLDKRLTYLLFIRDRNSRFFNTLPWVKAVGPGYIRHGEEPSTGLGIVVIFDESAPAAYGDLRQRVPSSMNNCTIQAEWANADDMSPRILKPKELVLDECTDTVSGDRQSKTELVTNVMRRHEGELLQLPAVVQLSVSAIRIDSEQTDEIGIGVHINYSSTHSEDTVTSLPVQIEGCMVVVKAWSEMFPR
ncbi:MAG: hypothetical protein FJ319_12650 [SAR202 cluster bacterium]|nr:hypothetical protein [SAR202 cluster bacterium]